MARPKSATAELKGLQQKKKLLADINKSEKLTTAQKREQKKLTKEIGDIEKKYGKEVVTAFERREKIVKNLVKDKKESVNLEKQLVEFGKTAVIGAKDLASIRGVIADTAKQEFDQVTDISGIMLENLDTARDLNTAQLAIGTNMYDQLDIGSQLGATEKKIAEERLKLMSGQHDLSEDQVDLALEALDIAEQDLETQKKIHKWQTAQNDAQKNLGKGMNDIKDQAQAFGAQIMAIATNPMVAIGAAAVMVGKALYDTFQGAMALKTELGISDEAAMGLQMNIAETARAFKMAGVESADVKDAAMGLMNNFGGINAVTPELLGGMAQMKAELGVSGTAAANLMVAMKATGAASQEAAFEMAKSVGHLAQAEGVAPGQVMQDLANNTEAFASFAKDGGMNVAKAAIQAKKLGINFDTSVKIADNLLNFESSIQQQMEAEILLGKQLNLDKARQLALAGDIEGLQKEVLKNVGSEAEFNNMNVLQRRALAQSIGVSVTELSKMVANQANINSQTKTQEKFTNLMAAAMKEIRNLGEDLLKIWQLIKPIIMVALIPIGAAVWAVIKLVALLAEGLSILNEWTDGGVTAFLGGLGAIFLLTKLIGKTSIKNAITERIEKMKTWAMEKKNLIFKQAMDKGGSSPTTDTGTKGDPLGFVKKIKPKKILAGAAAMLIVSAALFVTAKALQEFGSVEWSSLAKAGVALLGLVIVLAAIGAIMMSGVGAVAILAGAAAMLVIAASLLVLGHAIQAIGTGFGMLAEGISSFTPLLTTLVPLAGGIFILAGAFGALGIGMGALAIGALALLPALPVLMALSGIGMLGMALAGGGEETGPEPPPITDMGVTNDKLDGVISAIGQLQADNRVLMEQLNNKVKNLGTE